MFGGLFKKKILVVEDEPALRKALSEKLSLAGYNVMVAVDGQEGLTMAINKKPKVILLDLMLPKMDGMSVLDRLRKDSWGKDVPVIILTNLMATDGYKKLAKDFKVYDYVVKSDKTLEEVVSKVGGALRSDSE
jgi:DNA-binding response OmpR family regulator